MLQLLCLLVQLAADRQVRDISYWVSMKKHLKEGKALSQAGVAAQDERVINIKQQLLTAKQLLDDSEVMARDNLVPAIGAH